MKRAINKILIVLALILVIMLIPIILSSLFIGSGYVISYLFNLPLFDASVLCLGTTFVVSFIIFIAIYGGYNIKTEHYTNEDCNCAICIFRRDKLQWKQSKMKKHLKSL